MAILAAFRAPRRRARLPGAARLRPFEPHPWIRSGHAQTLAGALLPRAYPALLRASVRRRFRVADDTEVVGECTFQRAPAQRALGSSPPVVLVLHGLAGSAAAPYALGLAAKAFALGWHVVRLNQRNCGGTEELTPTLYHGGLSADPRAVLDELRRVDGIGRSAVIGCSLGGNVAARLALDPPDGLTAAVMICAPLDLAASSAAIERGTLNRLYARRFLAEMAATIRRKATRYPARYDPGPLAAIRTLREFDDAYTAPAFGFASAAEYYAEMSALERLDRLRIPALILAARDDPVVPAAIAERAARVTGATFGSARVPLEVELAPGGGHLGFLARHADGGAPGAAPDRRWAEQRAIGFLHARLASSP